MLVFRGMCCSLPKMEPKAMASIDFCPLAKWVGEWRSEGRSGRRGIARPAQSAAREGWGYRPDRQGRSRSGRDGLALAPGGRNRPRNWISDAAALPPPVRSRRCSGVPDTKTPQESRSRSCGDFKARIVTRMGRNRLRVRSERSGDRAVPKAAPSSMLPGIFPNKNGI